MHSSITRSRSQWVALGCAAVVLAAVCLLASSWQWDRHQARSAAIALISTNYTSAPTELDRVLRPDQRLKDTQEWHPVQLRGVYEPAATMLLRNRPLGGRPGYHVLVPFRLDDGRHIILDRGYLPWADGTPELDQIPAPAAGEITIIATMRPAEPPSDRTAPSGQVYRIDPADIAQKHHLSADTIRAYGQVRSETPSATVELVPLAPPSTHPGSHLSYSVQWVIFALGCLGGFGMLLIREHHERHGRSLSAGHLLAVHGNTNQRRTTHHITAEEEEDAILDAWEAHYANDTSSR